MEKEWVERIKAQCQKAGIPFYFKQWGGVRKSEAGRELDGQTDDAMPGRNKQKPAERRMRLQLADEVKSWEKQAA